MTTEANNQTHTMRRYLLGVLPESDQLALEQEFFADPDRLAQMQEVEHDLLDEYARGELAGEERQQFERHYLTTPEHRARAAFAQELLRAAVADAAEAVSQPTESIWKRFWAPWQTLQFAYGLALAAMVLLAVVGVQWLRQRANSQQEFARVETERRANQERLRALEAQIAQQGDRNAELNTELERLRAQQNPPSASGSLLSFILLSTIRGSDQQTLKLSANASQVRLRMNLDSSDVDRFRINLRPVDGGGVQTYNAVRANKTKTGTAVSVTIPASNLPNGDYILTLSAVDATGATEELDRYSFRVARQ